MTPTIHLLDDPRVHLAPLLERYADGSLGEARSGLLDAHLVACDFCFAAYLGLVLSHSVV